MSESSAPTILDRSAGPIGDCSSLPLAPSDPPSRWHSSIRPSWRMEDGEGEGEEEIVRSGVAD